MHIIRSFAVGVLKVLGILLAVFVGIAAAPIGIAWDLCANWRVRRARVQHVAVARIGGLPVLPRFHHDSWYGRLYRRAYGEDRGWIVVFLRVLHAMDAYPPSADDIAAWRQVPDAQPFNPNGRPITICATFYKVALAAFVYVLFACAPRAILRAFVAVGVVPFIAVRARWSLTTSAIVGCIVLPVALYVANVSAVAWRERAVSVADAVAEEGAMAHARTTITYRQSAEWSAREDLRRAELLRQYVPIYTAYVARLAADIRAVRTAQCGASAWEFLERMKAGTISSDCASRYAFPYTWSMAVLLAVGGRDFLAGYLGVRGAYDELPRYTDEGDVPLWWIAVLRERYAGFWPIAFWNQDVQEVITGTFIDALADEALEQNEYEWASDESSREIYEQDRAAEAERLAQRRATAAASADVQAVRRGLERLRSDPVAAAWLIGWHDCSLADGGSTPWWYSTARDQGEGDNDRCAAIGESFEQVMSTGMAAWDEHVVVVRNLRQVPHAFTIALLRFVVHASIVMYCCCAVFGIPVRTRRSFLHAVVRFGLLLAKVLLTPIGRCIAVLARVVVRIGTPMVRAYVAVARWVHRTATDTAHLVIAFGSAVKHQACSFVEWVK